MIHSIRTYIKSNSLPQAPARLLVAVSGGADSVALLHILVELGYACIVAHCNFKLRGKESESDITFVDELAKKLKLPFISANFDTTSYAKANKLSIEMAARELRYNWFEEMRKKYQAKAIAVAHHADDKVETFLMNISRGTGIHGLTGIKARNGFIIRPLLGVSRMQIEAYLSTNKINFVVDSTNLEQEYTRNKFRHTVIPQLEEINPSFKNTINETINRLAEVEIIYNQHIEKIKASLIKETNDGFSIDINLLKKQSTVSSILHEILSPVGFSSSNIQSLIINLDGISGKQFFSTTHRIIKDRKHIFVSPIAEKEEGVYYIEKNQDKVISPIQMELEYLNINNTSIKKDKSYAFLDLNSLKFPLILRKWQDGDYFIPFGMKGKKKLSDYFIDKKFTITQKENMWVLISGKDLVWLVGERIDQRFGIGTISTKILKIRLLN